MNGKKVVDLFSGAGGLACGFEKSGFEIEASFEFWKEAVEILKNNFSHKVVEFDLSEYEKAITAIKEYSPDVIIGGPPCQDFSLAGNREEGARASLTVDFARIISSLKPDMFLFENVARARLSKAYSDMKEIVKSSGYGISEIVIDSYSLGVPQKRKRFFCIGKLGEKDGFMDDHIADYLERHKKNVSVREYFAEMDHSYEFEHYYRHPRTYAARAIFSLDEPSPTIRGVNPTVPKTYRIYEKDSCSDLTQVRNLTFTERSYIQTFPKEFKWTGKKANIEKMIGNAVPPLLAYHLGKMMLEYLENQEQNN